MKDDRLYLIHIGECISQIEQYTAGELPALNSEVQAMMSEIG